MTDPTWLNRETLLYEIKHLLPDPIEEQKQIDGSIILVGGDPGEVIVRITSSKISIAEYAAGWQGPYTPIVRPKQIARLNWKCLPAPRTMELLHMLIESTREIRRAQYRKCERCGENKPPEWIHDEGICQSCAERHLGVHH